MFLFAITYGYFWYSCAYIIILNVFRCNRTYYESTSIHLLIYVFHNPDSRYVFYFSYLFSKEQKPFRKISRISNYSYSHSKICQTHISIYKGSYMQAVTLKCGVDLKHSTRTQEKIQPYTFTRTHMWPYLGISWTHEFELFLRVISFYL